MKDKLKNAIENCARRIERFKIDGKEIGFIFAQHAVQRWSDNFFGILSNSNLLADLLDNIEFISDDSILRSTLNFVDTHFYNQDIYFTSFGDENESSSRIVAQLNNKTNYSRDIFSLLTRFSEQNIKNAKIVFIDDFLNSGGQFASIVNNWFCRFSKRRSIEDDKLLNILKQCDLCFVFAMGMETGRLRAETELKKLNLNGSIHIITQYDDNCGIFGDKTNISNIMHRSLVLSQNESVFKNYTCAEIAEFFDICYLAGKQLYAAKNPNHDEEKISSRILGYGNSAKLFIGQNNIPTCTLTSLWLDGVVCINDKEINWQPLFNRKKKEVGGSEDKRITVSLSDRFSRSYLDLIEGRESVLEIAVSDQIPCNKKALSSFWQDFSQEIFDPMDSDLTDFFKTNNLTLIKKAESSFYRKINNRLKLFKNAADKNPLNLKISNMIFLNIGRMKSFLSIRFEFTEREINLKNALEINALLGQKQQRKDSCFFMFKNEDNSTCSFFLNQLFEAVKNNISTEKMLSFSDISSIAKCKNPGRFRQFSYLRENGDYFRSAPRQLNEFIKLASDFNMPVEKNLQAADSFKTLDLAVEAVISYSSKGMVFTGSNITKNLSLKHYFFNHNGFCYFLVWHLDLLIREYRLTYFKKTSNSKKIKKWLERFSLFPFESISSLDYLNLYCEKLCLHFNVEKNLKQILRHKI